MGALGREVKLIPAKKVRPFVGGNENDAHDVRAIWTAVQQPGIRAVAIKSEEQQAVLALHRMRGQLVKFRTAQVNALRGLLAEYGEVMPQGAVGDSPRDCRGPGASLPAGCQRWLSSGGEGVRRAVVYRRRHAYISRFYSNH